MHFQIHQWKAALLHLWLCLILIFCKACIYVGKYSMKSVTSGNSERYRYRYQMKIVQIISPQQHGANA